MNEGETGNGSSAQSRVLRRKQPRRGRRSTTSFSGARSPLPRNPQGSCCALARRRGSSTMNGYPMILNRMALGLSVAMVLAVTGCGGDDPLTGTWSNESCFGSSSTPAGVEKCKTSLTFDDDLTFSIQAQEFAMPATATAPGCTTTREIEGQTWSTDGSTLTLEGSAKATSERSSCVNERDEFKAGPTVDMEIPTGDATYTIVDKSLTIESGPLKGTYTR
jgi:hypothetical protein